ncbi:MAG: hypothetical protein A2901_03915 [Elusimicrobia bacterium RIFCSPLOWO2_01_FULL_54_10]|nr:MAG: hypothetical protein A2901_03915 [Elusimicrobia bacterium RIFCSPLOWO2_01_FULL_54_10]
MMLHVEPSTISINGQQYCNGYWFKGKSGTIEMRFEWIDSSMEQFWISVSPSVEGYAGYSYFFTDVGFYGKRKLMLKRITRENLNEK